MNHLVLNLSAHLKSVILDELDEHFKSLVVLCCVLGVLSGPVSKLLITHLRINVPLLTDMQPDCLTSLEGKQHQRNDVMPIAFLPKAIMHLWLKWFILHLLGNSTSKAEMELGELVHVTHLEVVPAHSNPFLPQSTVREELVSQWNKFSPKNPAYITASFHV